MLPVGTGCYWRFPLPVEVIPMASTYVARQITKLRRHAQTRAGVVTDNGNHIIDVYDLHIHEPKNTGNPAQPNCRCSYQWFVRPAGRGCFIPRRE